MADASSHKEKPMIHPFVSLSFDDGRKDNVTVAVPILNKYRIPATFNITTAYVDGTASDQNKPCNNEPMRVEDVISLGRSSRFEIACHGDMHNNGKDNILAGKHKLNYWLKEPNGRKMGFASPSSLAQVNDMHSTGLDQFAYIRTGLKRKTMQAVPSFIRRFSTYVFRSKTGYIMAYKDTLKSPIEGSVIYSLPIVKKTTISQVLAAVDWSVNRDYPIVLMFHSILDPGQSFYDDDWTWDRSNFETLCVFLDKHRNDNKYKLATTMEGYLSTLKSGKEDSRV